MIEFGSVVLVSIPYTDLSGDKKRPAVIVSTGEYIEARPDVMVMPLTSADDRPLRYGSILIQDWRGAGLDRPSALKPVIYTVSKSRIGATFGALVELDAQKVRTLLGLLFPYWSEAQGREQR